MTEYSRWIELYATSPSGKSLFVCKMCGRQSPVPLARCATPPEVRGKAPLPCQLLEELEGAVLAVERAEVMKGLKFMVVDVSPKPAPDVLDKFVVQWRDESNMYGIAKGFMTKPAAHLVFDEDEQNDERSR